MSAFVSAVIVAAGGSVRMGIADSKQFQQGFKTRQGR